MNTKQRNSQKRGFSMMSQAIMQWAMQKDAMKQQEALAQLALEKRKQDLAFEEAKMKMQASKEIAVYKEKEKITGKRNETEVGSTKPIKGVKNKVAAYKGDGKWEIVSTDSKAESQPYTKQQLVDDTRGYYSLLMDALKDEDGYVRKESLKEYNDLASSMKSDMKVIGSGMLPSWLSENKKGEDIIKNIQEQTKQRAVVSIPESKLPNNMDTSKIARELMGSPIGVYDVDGIRFRWDGKNAIPYKVYRYSINPDGSSQEVK